MTFSNGRAGGSFGSPVAPSNGRAGRRWLALPVAPDSLADRHSVKAGKFPGADSFSMSKSDSVSVTDCLVHALSCAPSAWIEAAWAARDAAERGMNEERRGWFEGVKCLLLERDLPASRVFVEAEWSGFKG
jgi:hypothetical protein